MLKHAAYHDTCFCYSAVWIETALLMPVSFPIHIFLKIWAVMLQKEQLYHASIMSHADNWYIQVFCASKFVFGCVWVFVREGEHAHASPGVAKGTKS